MNTQTTSRRPLPIRNHLHFRYVPQALGIAGKSISALALSYPLAQTTTDVTAATAIGVGGAEGSTFYQFLYAGAIALGQPAASAQALAVAILTPFANTFADLSTQDEQERIIINKLVAALKGSN